MSPGAQRVISLAIGLAALVTMVWAAIAKVDLGYARELLGMAAGSALGILVPAPGHSAALVKAIEQSAAALSRGQEPRAADSTEALK